MPIKPANRALYPADWPEIRARILRRAGWRCEHDGCGARQYSVGWWISDPNARFWRWSAWWGQNDSPRTYSDARKIAAACFHDQGEEGQKPIVIVLTIAHLNHDPRDSRDENLRALCQRHHLAHDLDHHRANAQATRRAKAGTMEMF